MCLHSTRLAAAALAAAFGTALTLFRWSAQGNRELVDAARAVQRGEELEAHIEAGRRRDEAKRALAAEVVAGRMTVREAAGRFRRLDEAAPGVARPAADDRVLDCAWEVLAGERRFAEAARWYAEVFTAHPHLLAGPPNGHRYYAACAAALAGCGQGRDAAGLAEEGRAGLRHRALGWLRDELEAHRRILEADPELRWGVAGSLKRWVWEPYFAGVRGPEALARLPEPKRQAWQKLWADVADTLARAEGTTPPEPKDGR
jgi:hypothetical protein